MWTSETFFVRTSQAQAWVVSFVFTWSLHFRNCFNKSTTLYGVSECKQSYQYLSLDCTGKQNAWKTLSIHLAIKSEISSQTEYQCHCGWIKHIQQLNKNACEAYFNLDTCISTWFSLPSLWTELWSSPFCPGCPKLCDRRAKTAVFCVHFVPLNRQHALYFLHLSFHKNLARLSCSDWNLQQTHLQQNTTNCSTSESWMKGLFLFDSAFCIDSDRKRYLTELLLPNPSTFIYLLRMDGQATWTSLSRLNLSYNFSKVHEVMRGMTVFPLQSDFLKSLPLCSNASELWKFSFF